MGRIKRDFERPEGKRDARLIVIATEGRCTERLYFEKLAEEYESLQVHVEVIEKLDNNSSPEDVLKQLDEFAAEYNLDREDQLWMVIDRDFQSWTPKTIKMVAQACYQKPGYYFALSNPAFEVWLLMHVLELNSLENNEEIRLFENKKVSKNKTFSKKMLSDIIGGYNEANYDPEVFMDTVKEAVAQAKALDLKPDERWPKDIGTHVYRLVDEIINSN